MPTRGGISAINPPIDAPPTRVLSTGEGVWDQTAGCADSAAVNSGELLLQYFTARRTEVITQIRHPNGVTPAAATPTKIRWAVYSVGSDDGLTAELANTANDTTLLGTTLVEYTKAFQASFTKYAGVRYAVGFLVVSGAAMPTTIGRTFAATNTTATQMGRAPRFTALLASQTDLPAAPVAVGSLTATRRNFYCELLQ